MEKMTSEQLAEFHALQDRMLITFQVLSQAMIRTATAIKDFYIVMENAGMLDEPFKE